MRYKIAGRIGYPETRGILTPTNENMTAAQCVEWVRVLFESEPDLTEAVIVITKERTENQ